MQVNKPMPPCGLEVTQIECKMNPRWCPRWLWELFGGKIRITYRFRTLYHKP